MSHKCCCGKKALLSLANTAMGVVTQGGSVTFNIVGLKRDMKFFPGGGSIIPKVSGKYAYSFKVTGTGPGPNVLALTVNGVPVVSTSAPDSGDGIISVRKDDLITLQLDPASPGGNLTLDSAPIAGAATASLTLTFLEK
jgi:hypothetical protein